jgi:hypothetical protein
MLDPKIQGASLVEIKEKVSSVMRAITPSQRHHHLGDQQTSKSRLHSPGVEFEFVTGIAPDASITKHVYSILVPCIPLTFSPSHDNHLREIEEVQ